MRAKPKRTSARRCRKTSEGGVEGAAGGQFAFPTGIAAEQSTGDVYVVDQNNHRVQKFGPEGRFILTFGGEVNATTKGNVCAAGEECDAGVPGSGKGAFEPLSAGNIVAVGGARGLVYVGDTERVEAFEPSGVWQADVSLASLGPGRVNALAIDPAGDLYVNTRPRQGFASSSQKGQKAPRLSNWPGQFDAGSSTAGAVAITPAGDILVVDNGEGSHVLVYTPSGENMSNSSPEGTVGAPQRRFL